MTAATAPAAAYSASGSTDDLQCPECPFVGRTAGGLRAHFTKKHPESEWPAEWKPPPPPAREPQRGEGGRFLPKGEPAGYAAQPGPGGVSAPPGPAPLSTPPRPPKELEEIRARFEGGVQTVGGFAFAFGLQTAGVVVNNRASPLSFEVIAYAQRNPAVMAAIEAFNGVMGAGKLAEIGSAVALGVGVDLGKLHPARSVHLGPVQLPGFILLKPIERDMEEVRQIRAQAEQMRLAYEQQMAAAAAAANGVRAADGAAAAAD